MAGGFFNRMYYGNPNKPDLKKEDVKEGRFKLFSVVLQVRFWKLIQLNLLYSIFWVPFFFVIYSHLMAMTQVIENGELVTFLPGFWSSLLTLLIPCLIILGPATAGATYIIRNWARDVHAWLWSDFKDAWKKNWKSSLLIMLINGVALFAFYVNINFYSTRALTNIFFLILRYMIIIIGIIYSMVSMFVFPMLVTYKLKLREIYKNALIFTMAELPRSLAIFIPSFLLFGVIFYYSITFIIPFFLIGLTFPMLIMISYTNWVFDKYMNKERDVQKPADKD